jgi:endonuclease/exonuclease/phosphatase family metal-dependent hydrolase
MLDTEPQALNARSGWLPEIETTVIAGRRRLGGLAIGLLIAALAFCLIPSRVAAAEPVQNPGQVGVMTRNLYLGADLGPAIGAMNLSDFVDANGHILARVTENNFPVRAKGLAQEILDKKPDLVGLQEVSLWRTGPTSLAPLQSGPTATNVRYDYLELLLDELNKGGQLYKPVVVEPEFDFEAPANEKGGTTADCDDNSPPNQNCSNVPTAELNARLTMRDVILVRRDRDIKVSGEQGGHFDHLLSLRILGQIPITVTRGWTRVDAAIRGGPPFRFVNTHLEAFDNGTIRAQQAQELVASGGPADSKLPAVLLGDFNSDDDTVQGDDRLAYQKLLDAGFVERSTGNPRSCCIDSDLLTQGSVADFDHQVDHILTKAPQKVELVESSVTGRSMQNGFWDSDHAGIFSLLRIPAPSESSPEAPSDSTTTEPPAGSEPGSETPSDSTTPESPTGSEPSPGAPSDSTTTASP